MFSRSIVQEAMQRALADGALHPIETQTILLDSEGVRFIVRAVSSLARKDKARDAAVATDPLGDYDPSLFVDHLAPAHYILLNKFPLLAGHLLLVTQRFERQERLLSVDDFACGISAVATADGELHSAPYNLLVRRSWMLVVRAVGPMHVLRAVAMPS